MSLIKAKGYYKPFLYQWAFEAYRDMSQAHWGPHEVQMAQDIADWKSGKLSDKEKNLITQILRFFTQGDVDIGQAYLDKFIPVFKNEEVRMALATIASFECIHQDAYSYYLDSIGIPEVEYKAFMEYEQMAAKHNYLQEVNTDTPEDIVKSLAIFSAFGEGVQLFSSFAILLNFPRHGKLIGVEDLIGWSTKDESQHVDFMIRVFKQYIKENRGIWKDNLKGEIYQACRDMVELEDKFIDLAFEQGGIEDLEPEDVKKYIRFIADRRLLQLGLKTNFGVKKNPLPWVADILNGIGHENFFERKAIEYTKGSTTGSWSEVFP